MNRKLGVFLGILTAAVVIICIAYTLMIDSNGPEITFGKDVPVYKGDRNDAALLSNVKAIDTKDGDVSDSIYVDSVYVSTDGTRATATYVAMDSDHHVVKASQHLKCKGSVEKSELESTKKETGKEADTKKEEKPDTNKKEVSTQEKQPSQSGEEQQKSENPKAPVIRLNTSQVTIGVNDRFSYGEYIESITDDEDDYATLSRRLQLSGEYRKLSAGTYEIHYFVRDTDGNKSNDAVLTLIRQ